MYFCMHNSGLYGFDFCGLELSNRTTDPRTGIRVPCWRSDHDHVREGGYPAIAILGTHHLPAILILVTSTNSDFQHATPVSL